MKSSYLLEVVFRLFLNQVQFARNKLCEKPAQNSPFYKNRTIQKQTHFFCNVSRMAEKMDFNHYSTIPSLSLL